MSAPVINPTSMASFWKRRPQTETTGLGASISAATWLFEPGLTHEVAADADPATNIISLPLSGRHTSTYFGDGKRKFRKRQEPFELNIVVAGERPRALLETLTPVEYFHVYLPQALLDQTLLEAEGGACTASVSLIDPQCVRDRDVEQVVRTISTELGRADRLSRLMIDSLGQELTICLLRRHSSAAEMTERNVARVAGGLAPWQLKRACDALDAEIDGEIGLAALAGMVGCSPTHFSRAFKQSTGVPPFTWLLGRRVERARGLLVDGRLSLAEIALAVGFSAQPQFTTAFKRVTGVTPGAWRREHLE